MYNVNRYKCICFVIYVYSYRRDRKDTFPLDSVISVIIVVGFIWVLGIGNWHFGIMVEARGVRLISVLVL